MVASGNQYEICIKKGREHRAVLTPERVNSPTEFFYTAYQDAKYQLWEIILASFQNKNRKDYPPKKGLSFCMNTPII